MVSGCHTCLRVIKNPSEAFFIDVKNCDSDLNSLKNKLTECVPELLLDSMPNALLCQWCVKSLSLAYEFKQRCLESQQKIYGYLQQMPFDTQINMGEIALYYRRREDIAETEEPKDVGQDELDLQISTAISTFTVKMPHNCALCKFSCVDKCTFRQHMILHNTKTEPYKCDECWFMLPTPELLLDHLAVHTNEKPYSCTLCDVLTSTHMELKVHGWTHRKPFQCNICWLRFAQNFELQLHSKIHVIVQNKKKFQCTSCDYRCDNNKVLENHINNNHASQSGPTDIQSQGVIKQYVQLVHIGNKQTFKSDMHNQGSNENMGKKDLGKINQRTTLSTEKVQIERPTTMKKRRRKKNNTCRVTIQTGPNTFMRIRRKKTDLLGLKQNIT